MKRLEADRRACEQLKTLLHALAAEDRKRRRYDKPLKKGIGR